jgi:sugar phosphate isomerase/epimerase
MIGLACASLSCDGFGDNDFKETFRIMPKVGYKYVELNCWHPPTLTPSKMRDLKRRCHDAGLTPIAVYSSGFGGENSGALTKDVAHKVRMIECARELGCRRIVATGAARGQAGGLDAIIAALREVAPVAEEYDTLVCLENHAKNNMENIDDYKKIFKAIGSPNVGLCIDTGHFDAASVDMDKVIDAFKDRINHIHVKETRAIGVADFTRFGQGVTNNHHAIERMLDLGYEGFITVELSPQKDTSTIFEDLQVAKRMFEKYETKE